MATQTAVEDLVTRIIREDNSTIVPVNLRHDDVWHKLRDLGTSLWLDTGDMDEASLLWNGEFEALTTNNTLLNKEIQKGIYDKLVGKAAAAIRAAQPRISEKDLVLEIAFVLNAHHGLRLVQHFNAFVSVEMHTDLADDVERSVAFGKRFHELSPNRFFVKAPLSPAGLLAVRKLGQAGIPVNFTLGFSARQNYLAALVAQPKYLNVFLGRLNAFVSDNKLGDGKNVGEKATLATQREILALRRAGKTNAKLICASMRDGGQVAALAGADVFTMPPKVAAQFRKEPPATVTSRTSDDPPVTTAQGVSLDDFAGRTLWEVTPEFKKCVDELLNKNVDQMSPADIVSHLKSGGFADVFPAWSDEDKKMAAKDGKIPVYDHWKDRLKSGQIGLDALMNLSAYYSFVADQSALDARVAGLIN
jgi:transaldolase